MTWNTVRAYTLLRIPDELLLTDGWVCMYTHLPAAGTLDGGVPTPRGGSKKPSPADFMFGTTLGEGAYARVRAESVEDVGCIHGGWR